MYCKHCVKQIPDGTDICPLCGGVQSAAAEPHCLLPGTELNGKYIVGAVIGEGGFGITYVGRDKVLDLKIAVKEFYPNGYVNRTNTVSNVVSGSSNAERNEFFEKGKQSFLSEARVLARFAGEPGIVSVRDCFEENNTVYIVMEYLDGETLESYLQKHGRLSAEDTLSLLTPIMTSLEKVHSGGMIHRDISPDNIMVSTSGVKLLDFGSARNIESSLKSTAIVVKQGYAPEEQYGSRANQGSWTDVYAICATMYKCITGETPVSSVNRAINDTLQPPSALGISVDPMFENALMKGMSVQRNERYGTMTELLNALNPGGTPRQTVRTPVPGVSPTGNAQVFRSGNATRAVGRDNAPGAAAPVYNGNPNVGNVPVYPGNGGNPYAPPQQAAPLPMPNMPVQGGAYAGGAVPSGKPKRFGFVVPAVLIAVVLAVFGVVYFAMNRVSVTDDTVDRDETFLSLRETTVTKDDMKSISTLSQLTYLSFTDCEFEEGADEYLGKLQMQLSTLVLSRCTGISDYSGVSNNPAVYSLEITECGLTQAQLSSINFEDMLKLGMLDLSGNPQVTDLSPIAVCSQSLRNLEINDTGVSDLSPLSEFDLMYTLEADNCGISDLAPLSNMTYITRLQLSGNSIESLKPLENLKKLETIKVNNNNLKDLSGIEPLIYLKNIEVSYNSLTNLDELSNATLLEKAFFNGNELDDISVFKKSESTLKYVSVNDNSITDLSPLGNAVNLKFLSFDNNEVTTLEPIKNCTELTAVSGDGNKLTSLKGIENCVKLNYIFMPRNMISDTSGFDTLTQTSGVSLDYIDLSSNKITTLGRFGANLDFDYIALYNNPLTSCDWASDIVNTGDLIMISYSEGADMSILCDKFFYYDIVDCPLDKQVAACMAVKGTESSFLVTYETKEEADQAVNEKREYVINMIAGNDY